MRKFAVGIIVGVMTLMFGSVSAFAITPADEAEAKYQAEKEAAELAKLVADASEKEGHKDDIVVSIAAKEEAEKAFIKAQAEYFEAKDVAERAATEAMVLEKAAREAKAEADKALDEAKGLANKVDSYKAEADKAYSKYEYAEVVKKAESEIKKLKDEYEELSDKAKALEKEQEGLADTADDLVKEANKIIGEANNMSAWAVDRADYVAACLAAL